MNSVYPVLSGALAQEKRLEVITNNLANVSTTGFKKDIAIFEGIISEADSLSGEGSEGITTTYGSLKEIVTDLSPGIIRSTGEPLDVAIEGKGFFSVQTPEGVRYTRNGSFTLNAEGLLTLGTFPVLGSGGPISLPVGEVIIDSNGTVMVRGVEAGAAPIEVALLSTFEFPDPSSLKKVGGTLFKVVDGTVPSASESGRLLQGALEGSNVNPVEEMVQMVQVMRLYEAAQKAIQTADEIQAKSANEIANI